MVTSRKPLTNGRRLKAELNAGHTQAIANAQAQLEERLTAQDKELAEAKRAIAEILANQEQREKDRLEEIRQKAEAEKESERVAAEKEAEAAKERKDFRRKLFLTLIGVLVSAVLGLATTITAEVIVPLVKTWVEAHR